MSRKTLFFTKTLSPKPIKNPKTATIGKTIDTFEILCLHANDMTVFFSVHMLKIEPPPIQIPNGSFTTVVV